MYDKICIINNIGLIQITHIFKIFVKIYVGFKDPRVFSEIGCPLCSEAGILWMKNYGDSVAKMG